MARETLLGTHSGEIRQKKNFAITTQDLLTKLAFPLCSHKIASDRSGRHTRWPPQEHVALTALAILTDLGFDAAVGILFFSGNRLESASLKALHNAGAEIFPQRIADFRKKITGKHF